MSQASPLLLCGPTAVGKTALSFALAERLGGEIISVDSMQVYRGMDIGTAKPTREEQQAIRHYLLDVVGIRETFDAASFVRLAETSVAEIRSRGHLPIFCGGTGLYFKAWLSGLGEAPPTDNALREELRRTPLEKLLAELAANDPVTYEKIDRQNPRRVLRAVEVIRLTGRPFSEQRSSWAAAPDPARGVCIGLTRAPDDLRQRINSRVDEMFKAGLVEETRTLMDEGLEENENALQALGYRQVIEHLHGRITREEAITLVKIKTWQFAKKQMTWFKRQLQVHWIHLGPGPMKDNVVEQVLSTYNLVGDHGTGPP